MTIEHVDPQHFYEPGYLNPPSKSLMLIDADRDPRAHPRRGVRRDGAAGRVMCLGLAGRRLMVREDLTTVAPTGFDEDGVMMATGTAKAISLVLVDDEDDEA